MRVTSSKASFSSCEWEDPGLKGACFFLGAIAKTVMFDTPIVKMCHFSDLCKNGPVF
jgi:hypothetical protein